MKPVNDPFLCILQHQGPCSRQKWHSGPPLEMKTGRLGEPMAAGRVPRKQTQVECRAWDAHAREPPGPDWKHGRMWDWPGEDGCHAGGLMIILAVPMGSPELRRSFRRALTWAMTAGPLSPALIRCWVWVAPGRGVILGEGVC